MGQIRQLVLSSFDLWSQVVFCVTLSNMLDKWAVVRQEVRRDMNRLGVPDLAVLQAVLLRAERRQEPQFSPDAEVRHNHIECLIEELVL